MIPDLTINQATFPLKDGSNGVLAVFIYAGDKDPRKILDWAVKEFTKDCDVPYIELIDATLSCPWVRVIVSNPDDMSQYNWTEYMRMINRDNKINDLLDERN
jgi:hypothetical protein